MIYTCNRTLFSLKKNGKSDVCYNMNETWWHVGEMRVTKRPVIHYFIYMRHKVVKFLEIGSKMLVAKVWGEEEKGSCCSVGIVSVFQDEKNARYLLYSATYS